MLLKIEVLCHYSNGNFRAKGICEKCGLQDFEFDNPKCANCGIEDLRVLSLDYIKGGHRKLMLELGIHFMDTYSYLKRNNYPEGWQVLCMNCQFIKRITNRELEGKKNVSIMSN